MRPKSKQDVECESSAVNGKMSTEETIFRSALRVRETEKSPRSLVALVGYYVF